MIKVSRTFKSLNLGIRVLTHSEIKDIQCSMNDRLVLDVKRKETRKKYVEDSFKQTLNKAFDEMRMNKTLDHGFVFYFSEHDKMMVYKEFVQILFEQGFILKIEYNLSNRIEFVLKKESV